MAGYLQKVNPGDRMRIAARTYNAFVDAAKAQQMQSLGNQSESRNDMPAMTLVQVKNASGSDCPHFGVSGFCADTAFPVQRRLGACRSAGLNRGVSDLVPYLEEVLGLIVRAASVSDADANQLLDLRRPAGDLDSKILLCKAFALIHPDEAAALRTIQKIRNRAAHFDRKGRGFDVLFDSPPTADQVACLAATLNLDLKSRKVEAVRHAFIVSARLLALKMYLRLLVTQRPRAVRTHKEIADDVSRAMESTEAGKAISDAIGKARKGDMEKLADLSTTIIGAVRTAMENAMKTSDM